MSGSTALSIIALTEAEAAQMKACQAFVRTYKHEGAQVAEMRQYADCVHRLHPNDISSGGVIAIKLAIVILIVATAIGGWVGYKDKWSGGFIGAVMGALWWVCIASLGIWGLWLVVVGISYLFK